MKMAMEKPVNNYGKQHYADTSNGQDYYNSYNKENYANMDYDFAAYSDQSYDYQTADDYYDYSNNHANYPAFDYNY